MPATDGHVLRRPHRTDGLITLHVGVLTKILALTTTECKARSRALSPMRSGRNNLRRGQAGPLSAPTRPAPAVPLNDHCPGHSERSCAHHASSRAARNKIRPAQALRRHFREITRPAWALHRVIREKVRPARLKTAFFGHFGLAGRTFSRSHPPSGHAGRTFSRIGHSHVATLKPMTPLQPLTRASMKPPSPLLTPDQQPLKPTTPQQPKNAPKTPISRPQRRRRFQLAHLTGPQRRRWFQLRLGLREQRRQGFHPHAGTSEQRRHSFQATAHLVCTHRLRHQQASTRPLPRKLTCNSTGRNLNNARKRCNSNDQNSRFETVSGELHAKLGAAQECGK